MLVKRVNIFALVVICLMFFMMLFSAVGDSAIADETAHISAGYSYVTQLDYRFNPEHPPLIKALSGFFAWLFVDPFFPTSIKSWQSDINGQWSHGYEFLYNSGNDADKLIFWARVPIILLTIFTACILFIWTKRRFGNATAILALLFFAFSPSILAHGHYVTTDIGAVFGLLVGFITFINFLERPSLKNVFIAGFVLGIAQLLKFSTIILVPVYLIMLLIWAFSTAKNSIGKCVKVFFSLIFKTMLIGLIGLFVIYSVYGFFIWNYPAEKQIVETVSLLNFNSDRSAVEFNIGLASDSITRPLAQYVLGYLMVANRIGTETVSSFLGEISTNGSSLYFPILYLFKEPLPVMIFILVVFVYLLREFIKWSKKSVNNFAELLRKYFVEVSLSLLIFTYWFISIKSSLYIGLRHVLPTFPFIYILVSRFVIKWKLDAGLGNRIFKKTIIFVLVVWLITETLFSVPYFLSYYNLLAGGTEDGYKIAVDSNYDWGQDLKRLAAFVEENQIKKISVAYFGGGSPKYYLGDVYQGWSSESPKLSGWLAVSANLLYGVSSFDKIDSAKQIYHSYDWLRSYVPVARAGTSIFIYNIP